MSVPIELRSAADMADGARCGERLRTGLWDVPEAAVGGGTAANLPMATEVDSLPLRSANLPALCGLLH